MTALAAFVGVPNDDNATEQTQTTAEWNSLVGAIGQTPTMYQTYLDDTHPISEWLSDTAWDIASWRASPWLAGLIPIISMPMTISGDNADADFKAIASGAWDSTITGIINAWAAAGYKTLYLRPGWEMNGNWMPWSVTSANAADFVAAFQHIAALAHSSTTASVQVVWSPNEGNYDPGVPVSSYYPGNNSVDIIAIDTYALPVDSDSTPSAVATSSSVYTLKSALSMAQSNDKPFALGEIGGTDGTFPANLASVVANSGVPVAYMALWDAYAGNHDLEWSQNPPVAAAWKQAVNQIIGGATVTSDTISLVLATNDAAQQPTFIVKLDGQQIGTSTVTARYPGNGQTFTYTGDFAAGQHTLKIDFTNVTGHAHKGVAPTIYVDNVTYNGTSYLNNVVSIHIGGNTTVIVGN